MPDLPNPLLDVSKNDWDVNIASAKVSLRNFIYQVRYKDLWLPRLKGKTQSFKMENSSNLIDQPPPDPIYDMIGSFDEAITIFTNWKELFTEKLNRKPMSEMVHPPKKKAKVKNTPRQVNPSELNVQGGQSGEDDDNLQGGEFKSKAS